MQQEVLLTNKAQHRLAERHGLDHDDPDGAPVSVEDLLPRGAETFKEEVELARGACKPFDPCTVITRTTSLRASVCRLISALLPAIRVRKPSSDTVSRASNASAWLSSSSIGSAACWPSRPSR